MKAEEIQVTPEEDRDRETVAYPARDEEDLEQILEEADRIDDEQVAEAVDDVREIVNDELRGTVTNHFEAPIRSLNNPQENTVEIQELYGPEGTVVSDPEAVKGFNNLLMDQDAPTREAQVVGEEYYVNQNLPIFGDIGNIEWWTVYDPGTYQEETRLDEGGEHLIFNQDGDLHGFQMRVDGEEVEPEQMERLARNIRIRRGNNQFDGRNLPGMMMDHRSQSQIIREENIDQEEFEQLYREAENAGLVNGKNITLKGWLSAVDLEAGDLRSLDDGEEVISFANLDREHVPGDLDSYSEAGQIQLEFNLPVPSYMSGHRSVERDTAAEYTTGATIERTDRYTEFETEELVEELIFGGRDSPFIGDLEDGVEIGLNRIEAGKVSELLDEDPFSYEAFGGEEYGERLVEMFRKDDARAEGMEVSDAIYELKDMDTIREEEPDYSDRASGIERTLETFGYDTQDELVRDSGFDEQIETIRENFRNTGIEVAEDDGRKFARPVFEDIDHGERIHHSSHAEYVMGRGGYSQPEMEDGELSSEWEHEINISNLIMSTHLEELVENGVELVNHRDSLLTTRSREIRDVGVVSGRETYDIGDLDDYSQEFRQDLELLEDEELAKVEHDEEGTYVRTKQGPQLEARSEFKYDVDRIVPDKAYMEAEYQQQENAVQLNDEMKKIGDALNPMTDSEAYDQIELQTDFRMTG